MTITFAELRRANVERLPHFKNAKGIAHHEKVDGSDFSPAQWLQAVIGELGEYANLRKKVERGDFTLDEARPRLARELADVVIYLDLLAKQLGIELDEAVMVTFNKKSLEVGSPVRVRESVPEEELQRRIGELEREADRLREKREVEGDFICYNAPELEAARARIAELESSDQVSLTEYRKLSALLDGGGLGSLLDAARRVASALGAHNEETLLSAAQRIRTHAEKADA